MTKQPDGNEPRLFLQFCPHCGTRTLKRYRGIRYVCKEAGHRFEVLEV